MPAEEEGGTVPRRRPPKLGPRGPVSLSMSRDGTLNQQRQMREQHYNYGSQ